MKRAIGELVFLGMLLVAGLLVMSCELPGIPQQTSNPKATVEALFDVDGHRIYRFSDGGHYVYFVLPARGERIASTAWAESCGENCSRPMQVVTEAR